MMKAQRIRSWFTFWLGLALSYSCGAPSPWANFPDHRFRSLTRKNLEALGQGSPQFREFKIGLIADPQTSPVYLRRAIYQLDRRKGLAFYLILGDLTDRSLLQEFKWVAKVIEKSRRPVLTVVGNHDGLIYGEEIYKKMFGNLNYSFVYNTVKFVMWNNNTYEWGWPDFLWLEDQISSSRRVVIAAHQAPGRMEVYPEANARFRDLIGRDNVAATFHGHTHKFDYARYLHTPIVTVPRVKNTRYVVATIQENSVAIEMCRGSQCERPR